MQDPHHTLAATASHDDSVLISLRKIADWDGNSQGIGQLLNTVFESGEYHDWVKNFRILDIDPLAYINNLDKVSPHSI